MIATLRSIRNRISWWPLRSFMNRIIDRLDVWHNRWMHRERKGLTRRHHKWGSIGNAADTPAQAGELCGVVSDEGEPNMRLVFKRKGKILGSLSKQPDSGGGIDRSIPIEVADDEECETADAVVCASTPDTSGYTDNIYTTCADCGRGIYHRPYVAKTPPKLCITCVVKGVEAAQNKER